MVRPVVRSNSKIVYTPQAAEKKFECGTSLPPLFTLNCEQSYSHRGVCRAMRARVRVQYCRLYFGDTARAAHTGRTTVIKIRFCVTYLSVVRLLSIFHIFPLSSTFCFFVFSFFLSLPACFALYILTIDMEMVPLRSERNALYPRGRGSVAGIIGRVAGLANNTVAAMHAPSSTPASR